MNDLFHSREVRENHGQYSSVVGTYPSQSLSILLRKQDLSHIRHRPPDYVEKRCLDLSDEESRFRGRPKKRWLDVVKTDMKENNRTQ